MHQPCDAGFDECLLNPLDRFVGLMVGRIFPASVPVRHAAAGDNSFADVSAHPGSGKGGYDWNLR
jgi:hypothetical protein